MIKSIGIENFKAIGQMAQIPLKPITLIFGPNSSGKSSIIQSLLLMRQSLEGNPKKTLITTGDFVDLGSYKELIHNHDTEKVLRFQFELKKFIGNTWNLISDSYTAPNWWKEFLGKFEALLDEQSALLTVEFEAEEEASSPSVTKFTFSTKNISSPIIEYHLDKGDSYWACEYPEHPFWKGFSQEFKELIVGYCPTADSPELLAAQKKQSKILKELDEELEKNSSNNKEIIKKIGIALSEINEQVTRLMLDKKDKKIPEDYTKVFPFNNILRSHFLTKQMSWDHNIMDINVMLSDIQPYSSDDYSDPAFYLIQASGSIQHHVENIEHIQPLRKEPKRYYSKKDDAKLLKAYGYETIFDYLEMEENLLEVNNGLEAIGVDYALTLQSYKEISDDLYALNLKNTRTGILSSLKDVGFGISQVLPIVVSCLSGKKKTFVVEQPELHLHPASQTELGDLFINSAIGDNNNSFVIETHSEHLILRLLRRIRESADGELPEGCCPITPDDIAVLYVQPGEDGAEVIELPVNEDGQFDRPWPNGFFAERARELF